MGLREKYRVIIGGTETKAGKASAMDADGWALNAVSAVPLCRRLVGRPVAPNAPKEWWANEKRLARASP